MIQELFDQYQITVSELAPFGPYKSFWIRNKVYILVPVGKFQEEELVEMKKLSDYMTEQGDLSVASFVPTIHGYYVSEIANQNYCLLKTMRQMDRQIPDLSEGKELAAFHERSKLFPEEIIELNRIGEWKGLWEKRLDQLEKFWQGKAGTHPADPFERLFIESFPYYLGVTENAIQYVVDTELDDDPKLTDAASICQQRFTSQTWQKTKRIKIPMEWVYDHPTRDLAEWIRHTYMEEQDGAEKRILQFLTDYESISPLSSFGWRMLFARLLCPLQYFETIEGYYLTNKEEVRSMYYENLQQMVERSSEFESFLSGFYKMVHLPVQKLGIREIDWLQR